ncbi:MAG: hypothetical protein J7L82_04875 [Staphylothermus sp.]|nr:hypothetical protein [Staphylothermus sp.]
MVGCTVSEKSLEMNVSENLVNIVRRSYPKAYVYGYNTRIEAIHGLDCSINIPRHYRITSFQFKKPNSRTNNNYSFVFNINLQHLKIIALAIVIKEELNKDPHIYYALPCICRSNDMETVSPRFITRTLFIPVLDLKQYADISRHTIVVNFNTKTYTVGSLKHGKGKALTYDEIWERIKESAEKNNIPTGDELRKLKVTFKKLERALIDNNIPMDSINELIKKLSKYKKHVTKTYLMALAL